MVGARQMVTAVEIVSRTQFRKQRSKWMRVFAVMREFAVRRMLGRCCIYRWRQQGELVGEHRARVLARAMSCSDPALCKRVWLWLVESFWVKCSAKDDGWRKQKRKGRGDGRGEGKGDAVGYDWSCAVCGWGGCSMVAGAS